ncbi:MAG: SOS response-associated peptidase [Gemmatimonadota bacterium]|uniref:SOS response-associated peptidase n=1 Tax=Candidatus Palauibacter scopulicola TaxID=3056741 RepID=UPI002389FF1E|nr:SOS response-associated peptidase [Candidatus Palauibacter scopulicola]MDE2661726.1 SOS response-associated peptidase [Candidatus Palauibacter scopulicola]
MCGRFSLQTPVPDLAELFEADPSRLDEWVARYNVAPTDEVIALRRGTGGRELVPLRWGLIPNWAEDRASLPPMINARAESLETRRAFRGLVIDRRCAVLADGFYEWRTEGGLKQPYFIRRRDRRPMALAGLWDVWRGPGGTIPSCTIVTTDANALLEPLHGRMPVILEGEDAQMWLDLDISERTMEPLRPFDAEALEVFAVSRRVNRVAADDAACTEPRGAPIREPSGWRDRPPVGDAPPDQLALF